MKIAYVLWHIREDDKDSDDAKFIGVYSSRESAEAAIGRLNQKLGFLDHPNGFQIDEYPLDKDHWVDGFISQDEVSASN